jgi:hypothetical protein
VIIARRPCLLIVKRLREFERCDCEGKDGHVQQSH